MITNKPRFKALLTVVLAWLLWPTLVSAAFEEGKKVGSHEFPAWFEDNAFLDLEEMLSEADAQDKKGAMLLFTTQGCSYCEQFIHDLDEPEVTAAVQQEYLSLGLEIFDDAEIIEPGGESLPVKEWAIEQGVEFAPTLLFIASSGELMGRYTGYQTPERFSQVLAYLGEDAWKSMSLGEYLAARTEKGASQADSDLMQDALFEQPPYALDRSHFAASQPLLVLFMRKGCEECEDFHRKVLADAEVRSTLEQFDVVQLDADNDQMPVLAPDGRRLSPAEWFAQSGLDRVPALALFNENGEEVLSTDALVLKGRMMNSLNFTLERAYEKDWTYQRFARTKGIERAQKAAQQAAQ